MNILVLQETDWLTRGPHTQHHIFETLSLNPSIKIQVLDYDMDNIMRSNSKFIKKQVYMDIHRAVQDSHVEIIRTSHLKVPFLRRFSSLITNFFQIFKIIRDNKPDLIVGFSITNGIIGLIFSKIFKIPFIFFYIDILHQLVPLSYAQGLARIACQILLKNANQVLVHTKFQQRYVINEGSKPKRVIVLPDGITLKNTEVDIHKFENLKSKFSINEDDFIIFFMGYLYDFAGLQEIIDYYNNDIRSGKIKLKFVILGDGGIYNSLNNHIKKIGANWVILAGRVPFFEIAEYIQLADLCLLSFRINDITKEIVPIKIFEYMAMKKPVLSNSLPSVVLELKNNSDVIFSKNLDDLIKKIGELVSKKHELRQIGLQGYEFVKKNYAWPILINRFKKIIIDVMRKA
jgi:glycosyltransferase involved in cell wall biosynthesis